MIRKRRRKWLWLTLGLVAVLLIAIVATILIRPDLAEEKRLVTYKNESALTLKIESDGTRFLLDPNEEALVEENSRRFIRIRGYDLEARLRFQQDFDWRSLEADNFEVHIRENVPQDPKSTR